MRWIPTQQSSGKEAAVDPAGAEQLRLRIEQQAQWREARSVLDGRQPGVDPDGSDLEGIEVGLRLYAPRIARGQVVRPCKRLVDGVWTSGTLAEASSGAVQRLPLQELARVV